MKDALRLVRWFAGFVIGSLVALVLAFLVFNNAFAQGHTHEGAVGKFYQSWMMPDNRKISCCHNQDCKRAQSRRQNGHWQARHSDADEWSDIPQAKIETERDSPDRKT